MGLSLGVNWMWTKRKDHGAAGGGVDFFNICTQKDSFLFKKNLVVVAAHVGIVIVVAHAVIVVVVVVMRGYSSICRASTKLNIGRCRNTLQCKGSRLWLSNIFEDDCLLAKNEILISFIHCEFCIYTSCDSYCDSSSIVYSSIIVRNK